MIAEKIVVSSCHQAAREYLARGWSVLPMCSPDHIGCGRSHARRCDSPGKRPLLGESDCWKAYQSQRLPAWLLDLEFRNHSNANVGIVLGSISQLVGVDVDGPEGKKLLLSISGRNVPKTLCFQTGNGFRLLYALARGEEPPANCKLGSGTGRVEILGNGLCSVMPPSRHSNGKVYTWVIGHSPADRLPAPVPAWLHRVTSQRSRLEVPVVCGTIESFRNVRLFRAGCSLRRQGMNSEGILKCLSIFNQQCEPQLSLVEVQRIARNASKYQPQEYISEPVGGFARGEQRS